jgi:hypothetical protein
VSVPEVRAGATEGRAVQDTILIAMHPVVHILGVDIIMGMRRPGTLAVMELGVAIMMMGIAGVGIVE